MHLNDKITLLIPEATATIAGVTPKFKRISVAAIYATGTSYDDRSAFINIDDANRLFKMRGGINGIQISVTDELRAPAIAHALSQKFAANTGSAIGPSEYTSFFEALNMEKNRNVVHPVFNHRRCRI